LLNEVNNNTKDGRSDQFGNANVHKGTHGHIQSTHTTR
jgi:hypothetical protein